MKPLCPYCGSESEFVDSARVYRGKSYGMIYDCRPCDAYVGVHKGTEKALGTLANRELRQWRMKAHAAFDPIWKNGRMQRRAAYAYLQRIMGMSEAEAHISRFNVDQCQKLVLLVSGPSKARIDSKPGGAFSESNGMLPRCDCKTPPWEDCEHTAPAIDADQAAHLRSILAG